MNSPNFIIRPSLYKNSLRIADEFKIVALYLYNCVNNVIKAVKLMLIICGLRAIVSLIVTIKVVLLFMFYLLLFFNMIPKLCNYMYYSLQSLCMILRLN